MSFQNQVKWWSINPLASLVYMFRMYHITKCLVKSDLMFKLLLPFCVFINIVPQLLLEFRYYIMSFLLIRSQLRPKYWRFLIILFDNVNFFKIYIFYKPQWEINLLPNQSNLMLHLVLDHCFLFKTFIYVSIDQLFQHSYFYQIWNDKIKDIS